MDIASFMQKISWSLKAVEKSIYTSDELGKLLFEEIRANQTYYADFEVNDHTDLMAAIQRFLQEKQYSNVWPFS